MARKSDDWTIIGGEKVGDSSVQEEDKSNSELETFQTENKVPTLPKSDSPGEAGSSSNEPALEALREAYGDLTAKLHSPILLEHLLSSKLLTEVEYETAKSKESSYDKNTEVLSALRRRTQKEIVQFCQLLFTCGQSNCGRILLAALTNHGVDVSSIAQPSPKPPAIRSSSPKYYPEMGDLKDRFIDLVREVKSLARQVEDLKTICIELLNDVTSTKRNVQEDINELKKCSDGDYIAHLQPYWDPLDCELLYRLIRQLKKTELMEDWESYKVDVKEACKVTLAEARRSLPQPRELPAHQISAGFQTDQPSHDVIIQKILNLRDFLKKMMGLKEACFEGFDNVDVTLFFIVNRVRLPFLMRLFALHRRSLQEFSITVVFVPGEFIYNVTTDQEFAYPKLVSQAEASYQMKDLKEEMLHQFQELKSSKLSEEEAKTQHLQNEAISFRLKLKEEEMLRKKVEEDRARLTGELLKMQTEKKGIVAVEKLTEKLLSLQSMTSEKESVMSSVLPEKMMSEVGTLLEQESSSLESLQDKLRILLEDWSNRTELDVEAKEESIEQFESQVADLKSKLEIANTEITRLARQLKEKEEEHEGKLTALEELQDKTMQIEVLKSEGEQLQHELIAAKMKLKLKEEELTKAKEESDMYKNSTVQLAKQKFELERQIVNVKGSLCKDHLETIEESKKGFEETASSLPDTLQVEKALLSASEKFKEDLSASKVKLEEQLSFSKEEFSSLRSACKKLEDIPSPTEEQKEVLGKDKMKMESLESTVSSVQLEYDKAVLKLKCCEMDVLRELPLKEEFQYMLEEKIEKIEAIMSTLKSKQEKLERDEYLLEVMEREKREALLKEENEKLTVDLEELQSQLSTATTQISHLEGFKQVVNDKSRQIEELQRTLKAFEARVVEVEEILDRRSKENSELRLLLGKKRQDKSEPSVKSRTSNKNPHLPPSDTSSQRTSSRLYPEPDSELSRSEPDLMRLLSHYEPHELNQVDADKELHVKATNGEYLVRKEGEGDLKLSIWQDGTCYHLQIHQKQNKASRTFYSLDRKVYFDSIRDLCYHYKEEPLPGYGFKLRRF